MANSASPRPDEDRMAYLERRRQERRHRQQLSAFLTILAILIIIGIITAVIFKTSNYWVFYESKAE